MLIIPDVSGALCGQLDAFTEEHFSLESKVYLFFCSLSDL